MEQDNFKQRQRELLDEAARAERVRELVYWNVLNGMVLRYGSYSQDLLDWVKRHYDAAHRNVRDSPQGSGEQSFSMVRIKVELIFRCENNPEAIREALEKAVRVGREIGAFTATAFNPEPDVEPELGPGLNKDVT